MRKLCLPKPLMAPGSNSLQAFLGATIRLLGDFVAATFADRAVASADAGDVQIGRMRVAVAVCASGGERQRSESSEGATELGFPGPTDAREAARRAGEPSGHGKEASWWSQSARPDRCAPSSVPFGGEAARGEMVEPHAVLEVSDGLDLGVAAMVGLQCQGFAVMKRDSCRWRRGPTGNRAWASRAGR